MGDAAQGRAGGVAARARFHRRRRRPVHRADAQARGPRPAERIGRVAGHQALDPVRVPGDRAGVRPRGPVRRSHPPARTRADRHRSVPGDRDRAGVRARRRPALLELLHLLRHAVLRDDLHRRAARAASARERLAARPGGLRAARGARRIREAHRRGRAGAGRPVAHAGRHHRLHLADPSPAQRSAVARGAAGSAERARTRGRAGGDHRRPGLPPGQGGGARRHVPPAWRDRPGGPVDDGDPDRPSGVRPGSHGAAVHAASAGIRGRRLRGQADVRPGGLDHRAGPALAGVPRDRGGDQAFVSRAGDLSLGAPGDGGQAVLLLQVQDDAPARRPDPGRARAAQRALRRAVQDPRRSPPDPGRDACCAGSRSTSCRSWSTS